MKHRILYADLLDMRYEGREKAYGAYPLRKHQPWYLFTAFAVVGGVFLLMAFTVAELGGGELQEDKRIIDHPRVVVLPKASFPAEEYSLSPTPPKRKRVKEIFRIPQPTKILLPEAPKSIAPNLDRAILDWVTYVPSIGYEDQCGCDDGFIDVPEETSKGEPEIIYEVEPDCTCGLWFDEELPQSLNLDDFKKRLGLPAVTYQEEGKTKLIVRILINKQGRYASHKVIHCDDPSLLYPVEKHLPMLRFTPAITGGKPVPFELNIPLYFDLI